jgi:hypothetical protein
MTSPVDGQTNADHRGTSGGASRSLWSASATVTNTFMRRSKSRFPGGRENDVTMIYFHGTLRSSEVQIIKALLVLLFLAPTLAAAEPNPESSFLRIQRDESREPVALQTVIAKYVPASGAKGVEIDLVAVVHIGEKAYYERLNKEFENYDTVLYELVAPEGIKPPKSGEQKSDNPLVMLQQGMKFFLRLEHQLEVVDYGKANFIHADLSP